MRKYAIFSSKLLDETIPIIIQDLSLDIENKELQASNLKIVGIHTIDFQIVKYNPLRGGKYIETPNEIEKRRACINIKNNDEYCFKYCIQCIVYDVVSKIHPERFYHYKNINDDKKIGVI